MEPPLALRHSPANRKKTHAESSTHQGCRASRERGQVASRRCRTPRQERTCEGQRALDAGSDPLQERPRLFRAGAYQERGQEVEHQSRGRGNTRLLAFAPQSIFSPARSGFATMHWAIGALACRSQTRSECVWLWSAGHRVGSHARPCHPAVGQARRAHLTGRGLGPSGLAATSALGITSRPGHRSAKMTALPLRPETLALRRTGGDFSADTADGGHGRWAALTRQPIRTGPVAR